MADLHQSGDEMAHHENGYNQANPEEHKFSEIFGENIFSLNHIKEYVSESACEKFKGAILRQEQIDFSTAENIAEALIAWAISKEVTHYTHWFHPLTGSMAEKHDTMAEGEAWQAASELASLLKAPRLREADGITVADAVVDECGS